MARAEITYRGASRTVAVDPDNQVTLIGIAQGEPAGPSAEDWACIEAGLDVLHQVGELGSGGSLQTRLDALLDGIRECEAAGVGSGLPSVPGLLTMLAALPATRARLVRLNHPDLRRLDLAVAWALGNHSDRSSVTLRDPVLASHLRRCDARSDADYVDACSSPSRWPTPLRSAWWDGERMAVWRSVPRSVRRQVGENFGPTCGDLAALWAEGTDHHRDAISVRDKLLTHALSRLDTTGDDLREYVEAAIGLPDHPPGARRLRVEYEQLVAPTFERRLRTAESIGLVAGAAALGAAVAAGVVVDGWMWWVAAVSTLVAGVLWATSTQIIESREHYPLRLGVAPVPFAGLAVGTVAMAGGDALGATRAVALAIGALGLAIAMLVSVRLHRRIVAVRGTHGYRATAAKHSTAVRALQDASQESTTIGGSRETSGTDDSTRPRLDAPTRAERLVALSEMYDFTYELVRGKDGRALRAAVWTRWFDSAEPVDMWTRSPQTDAVAVIWNVRVYEYLNRLPADGLFAVGELHHDGSDDVVLVSGDKARFVISQFGEWRSIWDPAGDWFVGNGRHGVYAAGGEGRRIVGLD